MNDDFLFDDPLGGFPPLPPSNNNNNPTANQPPTRSRMDILNQLYSTVFGRAPDSNAVMYYMGLKEIDENKIRQQMIESAEHKQILEKSKQLEKVNTELQQAKTQSMLSDRIASDRQIEIESLNQILQQKNQEILDLRQKLAVQKKDLDRSLRKPSKNSSPSNTASNDSPFIKLLRSILKV